MPCAAGVEAGPEGSGGDSIGDLLPAKKVPSLARASQLRGEPQAFRERDSRFRAGKACVIPGQPRIQDEPTPLA